MRFSPPGVGGVLLLEKGQENYSQRTNCQLFAHWHCDHHPGRFAIQLYARCSMWVGACQDLFRSRYKFQWLGTAGQHPDLTPRPHPALARYFSRMFGQPMNLQSALRCVQGGVRTAVPSEHKAFRRSRRKSDAGAQSSVQGPAASLPIARSSRWSAE